MHRRAPRLWCNVDPTAVCSWACRWGWQAQTHLWRQISLLRLCMCEQTPGWIFDRGESCVSLHCPVLPGAYSWALLLGSHTHSGVKWRSRPDMLVYPMERGGERPWLGSDPRCSVRVHLSAALMNLISCFMSYFHWHNVFSLQLSVIKCFMISCQKELAKAFPVSSKLLHLLEQFLPKVPKETEAGALLYETQCKEQNFINNPFKVKRLPLQFYSDPADTRTSFNWSAAAFNTATNWFRC